jgi:hypothetical protein
MKPVDVGGRRRQAMLTQEWQALQRDPEEREQVDDAEQPEISHRVNT